MWLPGFPGRVTTGLKIRHFITVRVVRVRHLVAGAWFTEVVEHVIRDSGDRHRDPAALVASVP
jgi:hypothetical protein